MTAFGFGADDKVNKSGDTMTGPLVLQGSPPVEVTGATAGEVLTSDGSGNFTPQALPTPPSLGLQFMTSSGSFGSVAGTITMTVINAAITAGYSGLFLDPRFIWDFSGLAITGVSNFTIESRMGGSIGWLGNVSHGPGFVKTSTGSPADGVQVFASPTSTTTQGVIFRGLAFVGANSSAVVHFGGGQRKCGMEDCFIQNTSSATGAYGLVYDAVLGTAVNSENNYFSHCSIAGAYAAVGLGIGDVSQHGNDTIWTDLTTAGGTYSLVADAGSNHSFHNYYDRSSPTTATVWNHGANLYFYGGEDQNSSTAGVSHLLDNASSVTVLVNRLVTQVTATNIVTISAGSLVARGRNRWSAGTIGLTGSGNVDISDPAGSYAGMTISGTGGSGSASIMLAGSYNPGAKPTISAFTGSLIFQGPVIVASKSGTGQTTTQTLTWTPPAANCAFRASVMIHQTTTTGTSTAASISFTERGPTSRSYAIPLFRQDGSSTAFVYTTGTNADTFLGQVTSQTDNSGTNVVVTVTPSSSTFRYSVVIEQLTTS